MNETAPKQNFDLRIVAFDGRRHALSLSLYLHGHDIYTTAGHAEGRDFLRHSHHASGQTHLRVADQIVSQERRQTPSSIVGKERIAVSSQTMNTLEWKYKLRNETKRRRNIVVDIRTINVPQFTTEIWAIESNPANVEAVLSELSAHRILHCERVTATVPKLVVVVWTSSAEAWQRVSKALSFLPP